MKCNVAGCESKYYGRGYCQKHYRKYIYVPTHKTQIKKNNNTDFSHPRYYNIEWMKLLTEVENLVKISGKIF